MPAHPSSLRLYNIFLKSVRIRSEWCEPVVPPGHCWPWPWTSQVGQLQRYLDGADSTGYYDKEEEEENYKDMDNDFIFHGTCLLFKVSSSHICHLPRSSPWLWEARSCCCSVAQSCQTLFSTPWTVAYQAPLSMGFAKQEYWSELPFPSPGDLPNPGINPMSAASQADSLPLNHQGNPWTSY